MSERILSPLALGAVLYIPACHPKAEAMAAGRSGAPCRTLVLCLEDAVREEDLPEALAAVARTLDQSPGPQAPNLFLRPRHPRMLKRLMELNGLERLSGVVLPKISVDRWHRHLEALTAGPSHLAIMPILETAEVFDSRGVERLIRGVLDAGLGQRLLAARVGANDLLSRLGLRRPRDATVYDTPLAPILAELVCRFRAADISLCACVFDGLDRPDLLLKEVARDIEHGLFAKTAIHPSHVPLIEAAYAVGREDLAEAEAILAPDAPAVFRHDGRMCEPAVHRSWALSITARAQLFGLRGSDTIANTTRTHPRRAGFGA